MRARNYCAIQLEAERLIENKVCEGKKNKPAKVIDRLK